VSPSYELFLRAPAGRDLAADELARALAAHAAPGVHMEPFVGEGGDAARPQGADLALGPDGATDDLLDLAFALARDLRLDVYDPQAGTEVTEAERESLRARCEAARAFRADTLGEAGSFAGLPDPVAASAAGQTRLHLWLIVAGAVVAFLLLARGCRYFVG
jgi:hypothetical protein